MEFKGRVVGETKAIDDKGMIIKATLDCGLYLEIFKFINEAEYKTLSDMLTLKKKVSVKISEY
ncbi:MAG: hypothetical protein ACUVTM_06310 [Candidatus Bathyarchaeia archaeon]